MKRKMIVFLLTATLLTAASIGVFANSTVLADEDDVYPEATVAINEENFPDENFRKWVSENVDATPDGVLTESEIEFVTSIECQKCRIADLTGIKVFKNLEYLNCRDNIIEELDVSGMVFLKDFVANDNIISKVNASGCKKLVFPGNYGTEWRMEEVTPSGVYGTQPLAGNCLKSVDFSNCISLEIYIDYHNQTLTSADFSGCTALNRLELANKQLEDLNVTGCSKLDKLIANENNLKGLDLTGCKVLSILELYDNKIKTIDLSPCANLEELNLNANELTEINVEANKVLKQFLCKNNQLTELDVSNHPVLDDFSCRFNNISKINLSGCKKINDLGSYCCYICEENPLVEVDFSDCINLDSVTICDTKIEKLNFSGCSSLKSLYLKDNHLEDITLTGCDHLSELNVSCNNLKALDVSSCQRLETLDCRFNYLKTKPGNSSLSLQFDPQKILSEPSGFKKESVDENGISVSWDNAGDSFGYQLLRSETKDGDYSSVKSGNGFTSYTDSSIEKGKTYYYKLRLWIEFEGNHVDGPFSEVLEIKVGTSTPTDTPTPSPTITPKPTKTSAINAFVERLYSVALNRVPESSGVNYWSNAIKNKEKYVSECARYFLIEVPEFAERGLSDEDFVETIYKTFFDREPSSTEKKNWTDKMQNGTVTRNQIVETLIDELPDFLGAAPTPTPSPTPTMTPTPTPSIKKIVEISAKNFPDNNFRGYISGSLDSDKDGWLSDIEINRATYLDVTKKSISSLKGIEYFTSVKYLMCSGNTLTSLNVSKNTSLTCLNCSNNKLTSLDVSKNTNLYSLETHNNNLSSLDVSNCRVKDVVDDQYLVFKEFGSYNAYVDVDKGDFYFSYDTNVKIIGANVPTSNGSIADFAERLYTVALNRKSDADGKKYWVDEIKNGNKTGGECAHFFLIDAPEFLNRGLSDDEFVETLYKTFFGRESEPAGKAYWVGELKKGTKTREDVIGGFIDSTEWCNVCATYGVKSGAPTAKSEKASENAKNFATRLYTCCLGRNPETDGLNYWGLALTNLEKTGCEAAGFFFTGDEFEGLGTTNEEYVKRLYKTFMDRTPAADEVEYWVGQIKSAKMNRRAVLQFFGQCEEFTNICAKYGIDRGTI